MTETENSKIRRYKSCLVQLWNIIHGTSFDTDHQFTNDDYYTITPEQVSRYMCVKAYGVQLPNFSVDIPTEGRSSTLESAKKAISYFMPNKLLAWNKQSRSGNPTRSVIVNNLIKEVKKKEVRKQGKSSNARRLMKMDEYMELVKRLRSKSDLTPKHILSAYFIFQFHMIARLDDVMNFTVGDLTPNPEYPGTLKCKMCWSKNVIDERDAPDQIVLGADNTSFCPLLALAIHLDSAIRTGRMSEQSRLFLVNKSTASDHLNKIIKEDDFPRFDSMPLGTHSIRKFPSTYARRNGCTRDDVDYRGRWKRQKRMVDTYIDVDLPYPDAKVASVLAIGGPVKYELMEGCGLTDEWVLNNTGAHIGRVFPEGIALVLGKALLWGIYNDQISSIIDATLVQTVRNEVSRGTNNVLNVGVNPVKKVALLISGNNDALVITELIGYGSDDDNDDGVDRSGNQTGTSHGVRRRFAGADDGGMDTQVKVLMTTVNKLQRQNEELKSEVIIFKESSHSMMQQMNSSIKRLSMLPVSRVIAAGGRVGGTGAPVGTRAVESSEPSDGNRIPYQATLSKCPRSLFVLWQEFEFGIGGRKPAKLFSNAERGKVRYSYSLRKHFWSLMQKMIRNGYTFNSAIDKIYDVYDRSRSVTEILQQIRIDSKSGGHPQLSF